MAADRLAELRAQADRGAPARWQDVLALLAENAELRQQLATAERQARELDETLAEAREATGAHLPATDRLVSELADVVRDLRNHERSGQAQPGDLYSGNLHGWMGERMPMVLTRLINSETELAKLRAVVAERDEQIAGLLNNADVDFDELAVPQ